jgi:hypothetical protein
MLASFLVFKSLVIRQVPLTLAVVLAIGYRSGFLDEETGPWFAISAYWNQDHDPE